MKDDLSLQESVSPSWIPLPAMQPLVETSETASIPEHFPLVRPWFRMRPSQTRLVEHYREYWQPTFHAELEWFSGQPSLMRAIEYAALAQDENGKRFAHQKRINGWSLQKARALLCARHDDLMVCENFRSIHSLVQSTVGKLTGTGEQYTYDTSLRLGAFLGHSPEVVYLHTRVRQAARQLLSVSGKTIEKRRFPRTFQQLNPAEIENLLWLYLEYL